MTIDLRSDTVTRPGRAMREAMMDALVGDVCFEDDPTVHKLEALAAERAGKEAAIFVPTGSMANQIGIALHLRPGDAILLDARAHIACWESGAGAAYVGAQLVPVATADGLPTCEAFEAARFPDHPKAPRVRLVALENTHNAAGGSAHSPDALGERAGWAHAEGLRVHLDGARIFNATAVHGAALVDFAKHVDTMSFCLSKGLGAPVGSMLVGSAETIAEANRIRHRLGGGWRQAGMLAAAGIYALEHHVARLVEDHRHAKAISGALAETGIAKASHPVVTNIIYFDIDPNWGTAADFRDLLARHDVHFFALGPQRCRIVTHLDVSSAQVDQTIQTLRTLDRG